MKCPICRCLISSDSDPIAPAILMASRSFASGGIKRYRLLSCAKSSSTLRASYGVAKPLTASRAALTTDSGETHKGLGFLADGTKQFCLGEFGNIVRHRERAVRTRAFRVDDALRYALAVECLQFFDEMKILQQHQVACADTQ